MCHQVRKSSAGCAIQGTRVGVRARIWRLGCGFRVVIGRHSATSPVCSASLHTTWAITLASERGAGLDTSLELHRRSLAAWVQIWGNRWRTFLLALLLPPGSALKKIPFFMFPLSRNVHMVNVYPSAPLEQYTNQLCKLEVWQIKAY